MSDRPDVTILDGATGSELDRRGVDVTLPLWSARAILDAPDVLEQIHREYLDAGVESITANTFRTHRRSLEQGGLGDRAAELTRRAVEIARRARDAVNPEALVLGSVAPLEDCYEPDRRSRERAEAGQAAPDDDACHAEHREMIDHLANAGVDMLLIETMNNLAEAKAAVDAARARMPGKWIASFCTRADAAPGVLLSGELIERILPDLDNAWAVGVNCVAAPALRASIAHLRARLPRPRRKSSPSGRQTLRSAPSFGQCSSPRGGRTSWKTTGSATPGRTRRWPKPTRNASMPSGGQKSRRPSWKPCGTV